MSVATTSIAVQIGAVRKQASEQPSKPNDQVVLLHRLHLQMLNLLGCHTLWQKVCSFI